MKKLLYPTKGCKHACSQGLCTFSCNSIPPGDHVLRVAPEVMQFAARALKKKREFGGSLSIDVAQGMLRLGGGSWGSLDSSTIPHAVYEYHTHPSGCGPESEECALDMPSDTDIELFCRDGIAGNHTHIVFSHGGTYVCSLTPALRLRLMGMKKGRAKAIKDIGKSFDKLQDGFEDGLQDGSVTLESFKHSWMQHAKQQGFDIRYFPEGTVPWDVLHVRDVPR